jgi:60 kDa SS-A/Ro ribonucleoprotein
MSRYGKIAAAPTPQNEAARPDQVKNNAGGFVFELGPWKQLDRFLVLGQVGATYYASERAVVKDNANVIKRCLTEDGPRTVARIVEISDAGRAPKNDPAIFALAIAAGSIDLATRRAALAALPRVCRIGTHLFHFADDVGKFRRWGRGLRTAIAKWYAERSAESLALQAVKYQQRDGWSHRDLLRLSHPKATTPAQGATFRWIVGGRESLQDPKRTHVPADALPALLQAFDELHAAKEVKTVVRIVRESGLPREAVPTQWLNEPEVWAALLPNMGVTAMIRNLGKMTSIGLLKPMSATARSVADVIANADMLKRGRVHPMALLIAQGVYRQGHGEKGKLSWSPVREIADALDAGFYAAFASVEPSGKNILLALDVSGSMDGGQVAGAPGITPRIASAAMAMVTAKTEKNFAIVGFTSSGGGYGGRWDSGRNGLTPIDLSRTERLDSVCKKVAALPMGGTDCALPMLYAAGEELDVDVFQIYTDNETWHGNVHPFEALKAYRAKANKPESKLIVCGLTATNFTIADPRDPGMLDVVGMDSHAPALMAAFAKGEV